MKTLTLSALVLFFLNFFITSQAHAMSRWDIKKQLRAEYRECRKTQSFRTCFRKWRARRKELEVSLRHDLRHFRDRVRQAISKAVTKINSHADLSFEYDQNGSLLARISLDLKTIQLPDMSLPLGNLQSHVELEGNVIHIVLSENDLQETNLQELELPGSEQFPAFLSKTPKVDTLLGRRHLSKNAIFDFYADSRYNISGIFIAHDKVKSFLDRINDFIKRIPVLNLIPQVKRIPLPIRHNGHIIGQLDLMNTSYAGLLIRVDWDKLAELANKR